MYILKCVDDSYYTGSTNIPAGVYRVYTTKPGAGSNITNSGNNYYFRGGNLT
jgi:predicted GIY-YIG superfamily endonuclease